MGTRRNRKEGKGGEARQALIDATLELIDQAGGCRGVTLRAVAVRAGFTHTNAYNYFAGLENLFWEALVEAVKRSVSWTGRYLKDVRADSPEVFGAFVTAQVEFAQAHPGWYRLMWLEPLEGEIPPELLPQLSRPRDMLTTLVQPLLGPGVTWEEARRTVDLLHAYVHGEICRLITRRTVVDFEPASSRLIRENALRLLKCLAEDLSKKQGLR